MPENIDLTGKRIGRFVAIKPLFNRSTKDWLCQCDCGTEFIRRQREITRGIVFECPNCVFRRSEFYIGGKKFGRLHVLHEYRMEEWGDKSRKTEKKMHRVWKCKCECGTEKWINQQSITRGTTVSCGCFMPKNNARYANETLYPKRSKIILHNNPIYKLWVVLIQKCYNSKYPQYGKWGNKGYTVCEKWRNSSLEFVKWMQENNWKPKCTIVCKEGFKEFNPQNCELIPFLEYCKIMKKKDDHEKFGITYKGKTQTMKEWAKEYNIDYACLRSRMQRHNYNLHYCLNMKPHGESGSWFRRDDIPDEKIKFLYEQGFSFKEIGDITGFHGSHSRLKKLGIKKRPRIRGDAYRYDQIINPLLEQKKSFKEILHSVRPMNKYNLSRKLRSKGIKIINHEIIYD